MSTTAEVLNALVDLRAIARGNGMTVRTVPERPERRAPIQVRLSIMSRVGGLSITLRRGEDAVEIIDVAVRTLEQWNVTSRRYEDDPPLR